jgi:hypothetical protein
MKYLLIALVPIWLNFSCMQAQSNSQENVTWYDSATIRHIEKIEANRYLVEIGVLAQQFYIDTRLKNFEPVLSVLQYSLKERKKIKVGIENNTNRILYAEKLKE